MDALAADNFPFIIEFDVDRVDRLCYAGHGGSSVKYKEGLAITPETGFTVASTDSWNNNGSIKAASIDVSGLSAEICLLYENESCDGSCTEILKTYEAGSLTEDDSFQVLSENNIANLMERDKLYSDRLMGLAITFKTDFGDREKTKTIYLYVCDNGDLDYFSSNSGQIP